MARVGVTFDTAAFQRALDAEAARLQRVAQRTVNELAFRGLRAIQAEMDRVFDRPTPWVRRSMKVIRAGSAAEGGADNAAAIVWKDDASIPAGQDQRGTPASEALRPQIEGGGRALKRFERVLREAGILPPGMVAVPAKLAELDRYGNYKRAALVKILSSLRAFSEVGFTANRSRERKSRGVRRREDYFAVRGYSNSVKLRPGIYLRGRKGRRPQMVMAFVKQPSYRPRFNPAAVAARVVREQTAEVWRLALERRLPFRGGGS